MFGLFKKKSNLPPEVAAIFEKLYKFIEDEKAQNDSLPSGLKEAVIGGASTDTLNAGRPDTFGIAVDNPIPVNGPLGEFIYLSKLRSPNQKNVFFHRIGTLSKIDVYETVSFDTAHWEVLYLDMYHPRKSQLTPKLYTIGDFDGVFSGTNARVEDFPQGLPDAVSKCTKRMIGMPMPHPRIRTIIEVTKFERTPEQNRKLLLLKGQGLQLSATE